MPKATDPYDQLSSAAEQPVSPFTLPKEFENSVGKIIRVTLINFLNHGNLVIKCSPNLNMIFGLNGQGKSAIVQGIALCFGGYGHSAGRDTGLKQYIKDYHMHDGPPYAKIELLMSNHGKDGYKPEEFGDTIIVSRLIKKAAVHAGSTFYMMGANRRSKTVPHKELMRYLRFIRLNIGNPTTYMDQESCKCFFFQSNPANIYRYYSAAAGLVEMEENINQEKKNLEDCKAELKLRKTVLAPDRDKLKDLAKQIRLFEEKLNEWKSAKEMHKLSIYKSYKDKQKEIHETYEKLISSDPKAEIEKIKESIKLYTSEQQDMKGDMQNYTGNTLKLKENIASIIDKISMLDDSINDAKSRISAKESSISQIETAMQRLKEEWEASASEPQEAEKVRLERELQQCHSDFDAIHKKHLQVVASINHIESNIEDIEVQLKDAKTDLEDESNESKKEERVNAKKRKVQSCRSNLYPYDVEMVRRHIRRMKAEGLFTHEPIGPIGDHLFVTRDLPSWRILPVVEHHLKNMLHTWLVATETDRRALEAILVKNECNPAQIKIIKTNVFTRPDLVARMLASKPKQGQNASIYQYLATNEMPAILLYVLDDSCAISRTFVCNDDREVHKTLFDKNMNVGMAYSLSNMSCGRVINGSLHITPCYEKNPFAYEYVRLAENANQDRQWDQEDRTRGTVEREQSLKIMIDNLKKELAECHEALKEELQKLEQIKLEKTGIIRKRTRLEADLNEENENLITNEESTSQTRYSESLEAIQTDYRKQLKDLSNELIDLEKQVANMESQKAALELAHENNNNSLKSMLKDMSNRKVDMVKMQQHIQTQKARIRTLEKSISEHDTKLKQYETDIVDIEEKIKKHEEAMTEEGIDFNVKLPTKNPETYLKILNLSNDVLKRIVDDSINMEPHLEALREKYAAAEMVLKDKERRLEETTGNYRAQKKNYMKRCRRFEDCRARIERKAKRAFRETLAVVTGYDGNLVFNDINRTLDIQIHNKQQPYSKVHVATDLKTLSGGEQSSIQLTMLQSLASISFSPVHMFDEVDVYMDESVRVKNIESLVNFAANNTDRQFFLVTPHSELAKHIKDMYPEITKIFNVSKDS